MSTPCHNNTCFSPLEISKDAIEKANELNFELQGYSFKHNNEQLRAPRITRVGIFQHKTPLPTWEKIEKQRAALFEMAEKVIGQAAKQNVNVFCFQEAWSM